MKRWSDESKIQLQACFDGTDRSVFEAVASDRIMIVMKPLRCLAMGQLHWFNVLHVAPTVLNEFTSWDFPSFS